MLPGHDWLSECARGKDPILQTPQTRRLLGEEIVIAKAGKPVARLVPFAPTGLVRKPGTAKGMITMSDDFDAPLPEDLQKAFEA